MLEIVSLKKPEEAAPSMEFLPEGQKGDSGPICWSRSLEEDTLLLVLKSIEYLLRLDVGGGLLLLLSSVLRHDGVVDESDERSGREIETSSAHQLWTSS